MGFVNGWGGFEVGKGYLKGWMGGKEMWEMRECGKGRNRCYVLEGFME